MYTYIKAILCNFSMWLLKHFQKKFLIFFKNILATALKSYIKWLLYIYIFFFLVKKFEKVEKTGFFRANIFFHCTLSLILGFFQYIEL